MRAHQGSLSPRSSWTCGRHLVEITSATNILDGRVCGRGWAEMRWIVELSNFSILLWRVLKVYVFSSILYSKKSVSLCKSCLCSLPLNIYEGTCTKSSCKRNEPKSAAEI